MPRKSYPPTDLHEAALFYLERGISVLPINTRDKRPAMRVLPQDDDGSSTWKPFQRRLPRRTEINEWFLQDDYRLGIIGGEVSGNLVVVDVDDLRLAQQIRADSDFCSVNVMARTPSGGIHIYVYTDKRVRSEPYGYGEIRSEGNYVVAPPSDGYEWENWFEIPHVDWVSWWAEYSDRFGIQKSSNRGMNGDGAAAGRHNFLVSLATRYRHKNNALYEDILPYLVQQNDKLPDPLEDSEVIRIAQWASELPLGLAFTDLGNAKRLVNYAQERIRYHDGLGWLVWTGTRWKPGADLIVARYAQETAEAIADEGDNDSVSRWSQASQSAGRIHSMITMAKSLPGVYLDDEHEFDKNPFLFNVANGTLDLQDGKLRKHNPRDYITKVTTVSWRPSAQGPVFKKFLRDILPDKAVREYVQKLLGYAMTGSTREQILPIWYGIGGNGKSTLKQAFLDIIGGYGMEAPRGFLDTRNGEHPTMLADLYGKRAVFVSETERNSRMAESLAKDLTGGERIHARRMRQDFFEFPPTHKLFLVTNYEPIVRGTDEGIWRRLKKVGFNVQIPNDKRDEDLWEKLRAEYSYILRWLVVGCLRWQEYGLEEPEAVRVETNEYREGSDIIGAFIADECLLGNEYKIRANRLFQAYQQWSHARGEKPMTMNSFARELTRRHIRAGRLQRQRGYFGITARKFLEIA